MNFDRSHHSDQSLLELYKALLLPRLIEQKMLLLLRQGKVSKWFSGIGQEAIAVGATMALEQSDYILPLHRNLGVFTTRGIPLERLFLQWQGKHPGFTKGRDRSFHFGTPEYRIIGMISHLGSMLGVADGISLASNLDGSDYVSLVFSGDGGASEGDFHEAINVAAVWDLPVIFLIENNGYGLSTPSRDQFRCRQFIDKAYGYGIEGVRVDGNNVLEVYDTVRSIAERMRRDRRPVILEAMTFRMRGHEEASGTAYVPKELFEQWQRKDPIDNYERFLLEIGLLSPERIASIREKHRRAIDSATEVMLNAPDVEPDEAEELRDVWATMDCGLEIDDCGLMQGRSLPIRNPQSAPPKAAAQLIRNSEKRFIDAISDGLRQGMRRDERLVLMGQDIAEYGGVFKITEGFVEEFGRKRVRNTPLCESAILGASLGLAIRNRPSMVEMQFADFVSSGFNQIANNLAKTHYRWDQPVNVTVRMPTGAGVGAGPFHSQSTEAWFAHIPGLKVAYPSTPFDAKGLLTTSLIDPNPVLFFEHKALYRSIKGMVPDDYYNLPFGVARVVQPGNDLTLVTYGAGVHWAMQMAGQMNDASIEIIDLRTLVPWDRQTVFASVEKTGRCLVLHEDTLTGGFGAEIAATIAEEKFHALDAPVMRVGSLDTPVPFNAKLEEQFLAKSRLRRKIVEVMGY
jgi:2-oxoisovalerate dehydrogenase E1 component